jgi:hypothetical protein
MIKSKLMRLVAVAVALTLPLGLAGCGDPRDVTLAKPGEYRGKTDPLLAMDQSQVLRDRFRHQMDR